MSCCKIELGSHYIKITKAAPGFVRFLHSLAWEMTTYKLVKRGRKFVKVPAKTFASANLSRTEFRFHIHQWAALRNKAMAAGFDIKEKDIKVKKLQPARKVSLSLPETWEARDYQVPIIEYLIEPGACKTITLQTGRGKTSTTLKAVELIGEVLMVIVLGRYYDKWIGDVASQFGLVDGELITARGRKELKNLLKMARNPDFNFKVIVTTIDTIGGYIDEYRQTGFKGQPEWCCPPEEIFGKLGVGVRVIDEVHQHFHTVFTLDLYTNVNKAINLSATLKSENPVINQMYLTAFPMETRMNGGKYVKVADCKAIHYHFVNPKHIKCKGFAKSYSHVIFEESLIAQPKAWENYCKLIRFTVDNEFVKIRTDGQKMLIFAARVETCELIKKYLEYIYPTLVVEKYTSEDDYDTFSRADIIVSTIGSSGTAIDIPGLITVLMTTVINSPSANEQALGRLRDLKIPGFNPRFIYFCCDDISKHKEYAQRKNELFSDMVFTHKHMYYEHKL